MGWKKRFLESVEPPVFFASFGLIFVFVAYATFFTKRAGGTFEVILNTIVNAFGWYYILAVSLFLFFVIWLMFSPYGKIKLGTDDDKPDFSYAAWFAMLFSAGMGIGLVFWSIAEPIYHFMAPPVEVEAPWRAAEVAMRFTYFHWGLHPWAIYIIVALSMAYFSFRHNLPLTIRSAFYPMLGDRIYGPIGHMVDTFAVVSTLFGIATSLGLGVMQINTGLNYLLGMPVSPTNQVLLIAGITAVAVISVVTGLEKGVKILSEVNMVLAGLLLLFFVIFGPTRFLLNFLVQTSGRYVQNLIGMSFWTDAVRDDDWSRTWTIFYWGWWIAWAPFVGTFIARISRGRTVREFISGVLLAPTIFTFIWLTFFGGTALHMELFGGGGIAAAVEQDISTALYVVLERMPLALITKTLATVLVATFFVTSSDSGTYVIDTFVSGGNPHPPLHQKIIWGVTEGAVAAVLLLAGGLEALQTASITAALPFSIIMVFMCYNLVKAMRIDKKGGVVVKKKDQLKNP